MKIAEMTIKAVDVFDVENIQVQLDKAITFIGFLVDVYANNALYKHFTAEDGEKLTNLLVVSRELVDAAYSQTSEIIHEAYSKK